MRLKEMVGILVITLEDVWECEHGGGSIPRVDWAEAWNNAEAAITETREFGTTYIYNMIKNG